jgi:hypothetical protein
VSGSLTALSGHDCRNALLFQPAKKAAQFGAQDRDIRQTCKKSFDSIQHHALGADGINRVIQSDEQAFQVIFTRLFNFTPFDKDVIQG